jgi:hypothetical protein
VLPSTVTRLERGTAVGQSLFDLHPLSSSPPTTSSRSRRRDEFIRVCPELVIVDEAHTCAFSPDQAGRPSSAPPAAASELAAEANRHLILVTATPHSGDEGAFRSLLGLLRPDFARLPEDLSGRANEATAGSGQHLVQRRRADIRAYMEADTASPNGKTPKPPTA